ncbi:hypothetical protein [Actinoplanes subglobosus]|uniref:Uncharacterized protein n=1 Tax=Actinoplanes subglobosus TaxID=1547892 RepID=A0ABV8J899_9ACTN
MSGVAGMPGKWERDAARQVVAEYHETVPAKLAGRVRSPPGRHDSGTDPGPPVPQWWETGAPRRR